MPLSPYLSFAGNCADAIAYYQRTLGAELLYKISFGEMPKSAQDSAENCPSGMQFPDTAIAHANVAHCRKRYHDERCYTVRKKPATPALRWCSIRNRSKKENAGLITLPLTEKSKWHGRETFWAHGFGKVTDKFGVPWMINVVKQQPTQ